MAFTKEDKVVISVLRKENGYNVHKFLKEFPNKKWSKSQLHRLIKTIDATGSVDRRCGSGRPKTARNVVNVEDVEELILSQEDMPGVHRTQRQISRETGIHRSSVQKIIKKES